MRHRYAVVSVYDKEGVIVFSKELSNLGITILSTGGTAAFLQKAGLIRGPAQHEAEEKYSSVAQLVRATDC